MDQKSLPLEQRTAGSLNTGSAVKTLLPILVALLLQTVIGCSHREGPSRPMAVLKVTLFGAAPEQSRSWTFTNGEFVAHIALVNPSVGSGCISVASIDVVDQQGAQQIFYIYHIHDPDKINLADKATVKDSHEFLAFLAQKGFPTNRLFADWKGE